MNFTRVTISTLVLACFISTAFAQATKTNGSPQDPPRGERRGPPPEALAACKGASAGKACSFKGREDRTVKGTCFAPEGRPLACRPAGMPPKGKAAGGETLSRP